MPDIKQYKVTEPWLKLNCGLGEAPYWHKPSNTLRFVDIVKKHLYQVDLNVGTSSLRKFELPISIGTTAEIADSDGKQFIFGGKAGIGIMNREDGQWSYLKEYWSGPSKEEQLRKFRSNDGAVDRKGRYFVGVMNDPLEKEPSAEGVLFRLDTDGSLHKVKEDVTIPNGISWSLDDKTIYFTDSPSGKIEKFPYDLATGTIDFASGKTFFECPFEGGVPDGHARDAEGCFWIACFGTGKVLRVNEHGETLAQVELPTRCVSCPGIAGRELFVTSAEEEDPDKYPDSVALQGAVFRVDIGVEGAPLFEYRGPITTQ